VAAGRQGQHYLARECCSADLGRSSGGGRSGTFREMVSLHTPFNLGEDYPIRQGDDFWAYVGGLMQTYEEGVTQTLTGQQPAWVFNR